MKNTASVPTGLDRPDAFITVPILHVGLTVRQLLVVFAPIAAVGAGLTYLAYQSAGYKLAVVPGFGFAGLAIGLCAIKFEGLHVERAAATILRFAVAPRRLVWAPGGLHKVPGVRQPRRGAMPELWGKVRGGDVKSGAYWVRGFRVSSNDFGLSSDQEKQYKVEGWEQFLNALDDTMQVTIYAEYIDIEERAQKAESAEVNPVLAEAARAHATHLRTMQGGYRRQVYLMIRGEDVGKLDIREDTVLRLMQPMGLQIRRLSTDEVDRLLTDAAGAERSVR